MRLRFDEAKACHYWNMIKSNDPIKEGLLMDMEQEDEWLKSIRVIEGKI